VFLPGAAGYDTSVAANGSSDYSKVDIDAAKALLVKAGSPKVTVRFMYGKSNTRRAAEFALIQASEAQAGITVQDFGNDNWGSLLGNKSYDAVLFAFQDVSLGVTGFQSIFGTGGGSNYNAYSSKAVDADFTKLSGEFDPAVQRTLLADVDKHVWADAASVTIFQFPDVNGWSDKIQNVSDNPLSPAIFWNYLDWTIKK